MPCLLSLLGPMALVFGAGHLRGSRLLSHFVSPYQHNIGFGGWGGVGYCNIVYWHLRTYVMPRCYAFCCISTHASCYATVRSLALPHIRHAHTSLNHENENNDDVVDDDGDDGADDNDDEMLKSMFMLMFMAMLIMKLKFRFWNL